MRGSGERSDTNQHLLWAYAVPYVLFTATGALSQKVLGPEALYALRIVLCAAALAFFWRRYAPLRGPRSPAGSIGVGVLAGLVGLAIWVALVLPFAPEKTEPWTGTAFLLRAVAAVLLVPLLEELLLRGYVLRLIVQWQEARRQGKEKPFEDAFDHASVNDVQPGAWTWLAVIGSSVLFALGHLPYEWPASVAYGLLMAGLWVWRKDLLTPVVAHAVTNLGLAVLVWSRELWALW